MRSDKFLKPLDFIVLVCITLGLIGGFTAWYVLHNEDEKNQEDNGWWIWLFFSLLTVTLWVSVLVGVKIFRKRTVIHREIQRKAILRKEMRGGW